MLQQLKKGFDEVLAREAFTVTVEKDSFLLEGRPVLQERNPKDSLPAALHRDGVRSIQFTPGLTFEEIDAFVMGVSEGVGFAGLGDDTLSALWEHGLPHVKLEAADLPDADAEIEQLSRRLFAAPNDDAGVPAVSPSPKHPTVRVAGHMLANVPESAAGAHPRAPHTVSATAKTASEAARAEQEEHVEFRFLNAALDMLAQRLPDHATTPVVDSVSNAYAAALRSNAYKRAARFVAAYPQLGRTSGASLIEPLIQAAVAPERLREVLVAALKELSPTEIRELLVLLKACGPSAMPAIMSAYPALTDPKSRRTLSQIAIGVGFDDLGPLRPLLMSEQLEVVSEAIFILGSIQTPEAQKLLSGARKHPKAEIRVAMLESSTMSENDRMKMAVEYLADPDPKVQVAAANKLGTMKTGGAQAELKHVIEADKVLASPNEVKDAVVSAYVTLAGNRAVQLLEALVKRAEGRKVSEEVVDMAVIAVKAVKVAPSQEMAQVLRTGVASTNKRVRDTATSLVNMMKRGNRGGREQE